MTDAQPTGAVVVDTMVISWLLDDRPNPLADRYRNRVGAQPVLVAFQTVMELRYGALRAGWGELRRRRLERGLAELTVVQPDDETITVCAELRLRCQQVGHALGDKVHDGDRVDRGHRHSTEPAPRLARRRLQGRTRTVDHHGRRQPIEVAYTCSCWRKQQPPTEPSRSARASEFLAVTSANALE